MKALTDEPGSEPTTPAPWWVGCVGYEVYPRSFADSNGDGVGDLEGIRRRLPHLSWLGVDAVWITPFYPSPGFDHGYDVSDYMEVDPRHGTLDDFDDLVADAHELGLRVIIDIVPNHSSSHHAWFQNALEGKDSEYRDHYIWKDPAPEGGPPNNWVSHFGGPAWTYEEVSGQFWCHLFLPEQPDLNWDNERVLDAFDEILRFWCDRGVDGFRIDVAHGLKKHPSFADNPRTTAHGVWMGPGEIFGSFDHIHDLDQDDNIEIFRRWNRVVDPYGAILIGEVGAAEPDRLARYSVDGALHSSFALKPAAMEWAPAELLGYLEAVHRESPDGISWVTDNHDVSRSVSRYGGGQRGIDRSLAVTTLMFALGGMPFLWEGQELGLDDGIIAATDLEDPVATRNQGSKGRDGTRTVMPWDDSHANGFTTAAQPWLHAHDRPAHQTVKAQREDPTAPIHRYRRLLAVRKARSDFWTKDLEWLPVETATARAVRRGNVVVAVNLGEAPATVELPGGRWSVVFASRDGIEFEQGEGTIEIPDEVSLVFEL